MFTSASLAKIELRRLFGVPLTAIAVLVVILVPLLYGALYLWAFWDPYGKLSELPVAVVNLDRGYAAKGESVRAGDELTENLIEDGSMGWRQVSAAEAERGLASHRYYLALTVPADFSERLGTVDGDAPTAAGLHVTLAEGDNMLASQIGQRVVSEVRTAASQSAERGYFDALISGVDEIRTGMTDAADGSAVLSDGIGKARDGADALAGGSKRARSGARTLDAGLKTLTTGAGRLHTGAEDLATGSVALSEGLDALAQGAPALAKAGGDLADGAARLDDGVSAAGASIGKAAGSVDSLAAGASASVSALQALVAAHPELAADANFQTALGASSNVSNGLTALGQGLSQSTAAFAALSAGSTQVRAGAAALSSGLERFSGGVVASQDGASRLAAGAASLAGGAGELANGADAASKGGSELASGVRQLADGSGALSDGLADIDEGSRDLANGLAEGVADMPAAEDPAVRAVRLDVMSKPVALEITRANEVTNYGTGFAPYFVPLALWVGALMIFFLVRPLSGRALASTASDASVALSSFLPAAAIALVQATIMLLVLRFGLGLSAAHPFKLYATAVVAALVFTAILQLLNASLGTVGKFLGIVLLMLQLTSAAGTFPIQLVPDFFQTISPYLPMTYVVQALRQAITGSDASLWTHDILVLAGAGLAVLSATVLVVRARRMWTMDRLRPVLDI